MPDMIVSGAGDTSVNGTYTETGTENGKPFYNLSGTDPNISSISCNAFDDWVIYDSGGNDQYYSFDSVATPDLATWDDVGGGLPVPTVSASGGAVAPTVTTQAVSSIGTTTATGNGNVTSDGGATITERGVCWNTSTNPTTSNSKATSAGTTGAYTASMTGLSPGTFYYVRAYAINSVGTSYGSNVTFTSNPVARPLLINRYGAVRRASNY